MSRKKTSFEKAGFKMLDELLRAQSAYDKACICGAAGTQEAARIAFEAKRAELTGVIHKLHGYRRKFDKARRRLAEYE